MRPHVHGHAESDPSWLPRFPQDYLLCPAHKCLTLQRQLNYNTTALAAAGCSEAVLSSERYRTGWGCRRLPYPVVPAGERVNECSTPYSAYYRSLTYLRHAHT